MIHPRNFIDFFKTPAGAFIGFCLLLGGIFFACQRWLPGNNQAPPLVYSTKAAAEAAAKQTLQSFQNTNFSPLAHFPNANPGILITDPGIASPVPTRPEALPISLLAETPEIEVKPLGKNYAPFGRLIPCELIVTVDSATIQTPIIGLVTEDIYHAGRLVIPAGTEVHGQAQTDRNRERIASGNHWTLVWRDGQELSLSGIALDREADANGDGWAITDGSAGLRGRVLKSDDLAEIKLFAASFLSGAASAFTEQQSTVYGSQIVPTLQNAPLTGAQNVLQAYAKQIYDSIQRDGFYVRVPAGKQFYLYVTQTIDDDNAAIGSTRFTPAQLVETNPPAANLPVAPSRYDLPPDAVTYLKGSRP